MGAAEGLGGKGLTGAELAGKEAFEEAGIVGSTSKASVGTYRYLKRLADGSHRRCEVAVFPMAVEQELEDWPEREERHRQWFKPDEAAALVAEKELAKLLRRPLR